MRSKIHFPGCGTTINKINPAIPLVIATGTTVALWWRFQHVIIPRNVKVVENFNIRDYAGRWYEIARFDFKHEKHLSHVTAEYSLSPNGTVQVRNSGFDYVKKQWKEARGIAKFLHGPTTGALKVSFFRPFYSGYFVVEMDPDYKNALVFGENKKYIWFLSRTKTMPKAVKQKFMDTAQNAGYDLDKLVWTRQAKVPISKK